MSAQRIAWLDTSRGLAFLAVIYSHLEYCNEPFFNYLSPFFLSTFFFVSGYLYKTGRKFSEVLENRTRTLYIPFLIYGTLLLASRHLLTTKETVAPFWPAFKSLLLQDGTDNIIWFIPSLYVYTLFFYWVVYWCGTQKKLLVAAAVAATANWAVTYVLGIEYLPYTLNALGSGIFWMALGKYASAHTELFERLYSVHNFAVSLPVYLVLVTLLGQYYSFYPSRHFIDWLAVSLLGTYCLVYLSKSVFRNSRFLLFIGANTLLYFILHGKVYVVMEYAIRKLVHSPGLADPNSLLFNVCGALETLVVAILLVIPVTIINRWLPWTIGKGYRLWR